MYVVKAVTLFDQNIFFDVSHLILILINQNRIKRWAMEHFEPLHGITGYSLSPLPDGLSGTL